jgi:hypothetical protein
MTGVVSFLATKHKGGVFAWTLRNDISSG